MSLVSGSTREQQEIDREPSGLNAFLQLSPYSLEQEFWKSESATRLLKAFDLIGLCYSLFTYGMLIRTFGLGASSGMSMHHLLPTVVYFTLAILQLCVLLVAPKLHQKYRFQVTLTNRLLRLGTLSVAALNSSPAVMGRMTTRVNSPSRTNSSLLMKLVRPVVGPPLVYLNHCNFVLPFVWVLPFQLYTVAACGFMMRSTACVLAESEAYMAMASRACTVLNRVMQYGSMALGGPSDVNNYAFLMCNGVEAVLLLVLYVHVILLVVLPLLVIYFVELSLKTNFVRVRQTNNNGVSSSIVRASARSALMRDYPLADSSWVRAFVAYGCVLGAFFASHAVVVMLSPLKCGPRGMYRDRSGGDASSSIHSHTEL